MDISLVGNHQFKIRTKQATVVTGEKVVITRGDNSHFEITGAGEYEIGGVSVIGTPKAYVIEADSLRVCVLQVVEKLSESELEELGSIDITLIPTSGDVKTAVEMARQTDPWIIISDGFNPDYQPVSKFAISRDKLPQDLQVVCLK